MGHIESAHFYPPKVSKNGSHCLTTQKIKIGTCTHALCTYTHALHTNLALHQLRCIILNYFECLQVHAQKMFLPFPQMDRRASIIFEKIHKTHTRTYLAHLSCTDTVTNICMHTTRIRSHMHLPVYARTCHVFVHASTLIHTHSHMRTIFYFPHAQASAYIFTVHSLMCTKHSYASALTLVCV